MLNIEKPPRPDFPNLEKEDNKAKAEEDISSILDQLDQFGPSENQPVPEQKKQPVKVQQKAPQENDLYEEAPSPNDQEENNFNTNFMPQQPMMQQQPLATDQIQEIVEAIVEEKWQSVLDKFGDLGVWKEKVNRDVISIKQEIVRTQDRFLQLQKAVMGKVSEYNDNIVDVNTEMKALEKVFEKIIEPLTSNIKQLQKITERLKK